MNLTFDAIRWSQDQDGYWLHLRVTEKGLARAFMDAFKAGAKYVADLKENRPKRSLDANAYFWVLAGKLSAKLGNSPNDVYRAYIPDIGGNYEVVPVREDRIEHWDRIWCSGHIGRQTDDLGPCKHTPGYHNIRSYFSSSDYDAAQMSRLIDIIVADCKEQGIETKTPDELALMKARWSDAPQN